MLSTKEIMTKESNDSSVKPDCMVWTAETGPDGYGYLDCRRAGVNFRAPANHVAYEVDKGYIPEGKTVMQTCGVRTCCNPAHLELVTVH